MTALVVSNEEKEAAAAAISPPDRTAVSKLGHKNNQSDEEETLI